MNSASIAVDDQRESAIRCSWSSLDQRKEVEPAAAALFRLGGNRPLYRTGPVAKRHQQPNEPAPRATVVRSSRVRLTRTGVR